MLEQDPDDSSVTYVVGQPPPRFVPHGVGFYLQDQLLVLMSWPHVHPAEADLISSGTLELSFLASPDDADPKVMSICISSPAFDGGGDGFFAWLEGEDRPSAARVKQGYGIPVAVVVVSGGHSDQKVEALRYFSLNSTASRYVENIASKLPVIGPEEFFHESQEVYARFPAPSAIREATRIRSVAGEA